ncbi:hypothetical protein lerEdw1_020661 [Lerista edwardsae]|nr:hypothetical protein lerEdw1_020661 [Lerista edwardsae]
MNSNLCWPLVRLAVLLGVFLVQSSDGATYQEFVNRHLDPAGPGSTNLNAYCNRLMAQRGMTAPTCKRVNTFINGRAVDVERVCGRGGGRWRGNLWDSNRPFRLVVCRNTGAPTHGGGCQYTGRAQRRRIRLGCTNNQPVHFEKVL